MADTAWTVKSCLDWTENYLREKGEERPNLAAEWLLCAATDLKTRTDLFINFDRPLTPAELDTMHKAVVRRAHGEPLQYITGETQFRMINVKCAPGVLIPRPETEVLVEQVLNYLDREVLDGEAARNKAVLPWNAEVEEAQQQEEAGAEDRSQNEAETPTAPELGAVEHEVMGAGAYAQELAEREAAERDAAAEAEESDTAATEADEPSEPSMARVLEVGCGTGCISLSLISERRGRVTGYATDIEPRAVELTCRNRDELGIREDELTVSLTNLVSSVPKDQWGTFDVLVSNPPYIPSDVMKTLPKEVVDNEPDLALDGGADGLDVFRRLLNAAPYMLRQGGLFACELFEDACETAAGLCREAGLSDVDIIEDLTGRPRIVRAIVTDPKRRE